MPNPLPWLSPPPTLHLPDDEVHVWRAGLDLSDAGLEPLRRSLSSDEGEKAARFHFEKDRRHYTAARGILRKLLGRYLGLDPGELRFAYTKYGKPELPQDQNGTNIRFNLAHSHGLALFAFTRGREIGVDLEFIQPGRATDEIAQRFFSPVETAGLRSLPQEDRVRGFFDCWTRKEAFIKARGLGLYMALDKFAVTLAPGEKPALLSSEDDPEAPRRWSLCGLNAAEGYAAALAVEGQSWNLRCWTED